jgi:hypothetical protein
MNVAIGIGIEAPGRVEAGPGQVLGEAHREADGANWPRAAFAQVPSSSRPPEESFRSSLQSQFASLVAAADSADANATEKNPSAIDAKRVDTAAPSIRTATAENHPSLEPLLTANTVGDVKSPRNPHPLNLGSAHPVAHSKSIRKESASTRSLPELPVASLDSSLLILSPQGSANSASNRTPATHIEPQEPVQPAPHPGTTPQSPFNSWDSFTPNPPGNLSAPEGSAAQNRSPGIAETITSVAAGATALGAVADAVARAALPGRIDDQASAPQQAPSQVQDQIENQPGSNTVKSVLAPASGDQANRTPETGDTNSFPPQAAPNKVEMTGLADNNPTPGPVAVRMAQQAPEIRSAGLAGDSAPLLSQFTAAKGEMNAPVGLVGGSANSNSSNPSHQTIAARNVDAVAPLGRTHEGTLLAHPGTRAMDLNPDEAGVPNSAAANSTAAGEQVSSSGRARVEEAQPQQAITQEQNRTQAQPDGQVSERVAPPTASDQADRSSHPDIADASHSYAALAGAVKPGATGEGKVSQVVSRSSPLAITGSQAESGNHSLKVENNGLLQDASALVRDSAGTHRAMSATDGDVGGPASAPTRSSAHDTFAALDADTLTGTPSWIHAEARRAEAGFQDPTLGWVGVRAEASGGIVHATLMPGSAEAAQTLGGHMAGLNAYLAEEHSSVATLTLAAPEGRESGLGAGQDANQDTNQGMTQGGGQNSPSESQSNPHPVVPAIATAAAREILGLTGNSGRAVGFTGNEGSHISVMA